MELLVEKVTSVQKKRRGNVEPLPEIDHEEKKRRREQSRQRQAERLGYLTKSDEIAAGEKPVKSRYQRQKQAEIQRNKRSTYSEDDRIANAIRMREKRANYTPEQRAREAQRKRDARARLNEDLSAAVILSMLAGGVGGASDPSLSSATMQDESPDNHSLDSQYNHHDQDDDELDGEGDF